jgi:competence ComEA-like helix-hairpin-helix protein
MNRRQLVQDYLHFSKKERIGALAIIAVLAIIIFYPIFFNDRKTVIVKENKILLAAIDTLNAAETHQYENDDKESSEAFQYETSITTTHTKGALFPFDPNTLSLEGWKKLGLNERTIHTIENYRTKGGKFYKSEDLKKIWGLQEAFYERVKDYISIKARQEKSIERPVIYAKRDLKKWDVKINSADSSAFIELPGIGNKLALRILNFRDRLGGFYSVDQIGETYGLADSTFQKIKAFLHVDGEVHKLNINTATKDELKIHPYIKWNLANTIVEYRNQHGAYKTLEDLKNISLIDEGTFEKIAHYLLL